MWARRRMWVVPGAREAGCKTSDKSRLTKYLSSSPAGKRQRKKKGFIDMDYQVQALDAPQTLTTQGNRRDRKHKDAFWGYIFLLPQLLGLLVFSLIPLISVFYLSMADWDGLGPITFVGL